MILLLFGFTLGIPVGIWLERRERAKKAAAELTAPTTPVPGDVGPATVPLGPPPTAPTAPVAPATPFTPAAPFAAPAPIEALDQLPPPPPPVAPITPVAPIAATASVLGPMPVAPNKLALKKGLTQDDFVPKDDILVRMQEAWERGERLEPEADGGREVPPVLEDKVQRVLARLADGAPGEVEGKPSGDPAPRPTPGGETVSEVVNELAALGYGDELHFADGVLTCRRCGGTHGSHDAEVEHVRRFEGESDPADEAIVLALRCPHCGASGVLVSPYGPDADPTLAEAFTYLAERAGHG